MPQNKFALARYHIIDSLLRRNDYVKTSLIVEKCIDKTGFRVSRRTIQLDIEAMRHDSFLGYNAPIGYHTRRKAYFYEEADYSIAPFSFTPREIAALERLLEISTDQDRELLQRVIEKMNGEIKLRLPALTLP